MVIDTLVAIAIIMAMFKGYSKGFIVAIFSAAGFIIGLAAALKLSVVVAGYMSETVGSQKAWMPFIAFILVMIGVMLLIRFLASLIQKTFEVAMLGWANRLAGIVLYALLYLIILSVLVFYLRQLHLLTDENAKASISYPYLKQFGPTVIETIGKVVPIFKNVFGDLKDFFGRVGGAPH